MVYEKKKERETDLKSRDGGKEDHGHSQQIKLNNFREDRAGCNTFFVIDHITFITQERQPKLISSERVICQFDFHQVLKFHTHVV